MRYFFASAAWLLCLAGPVWAQKSTPDMVPGQVVVKLAPAIKALAGPDAIAHPGVQHLLAKLQVQAVEKRFPHALGPQPERAPHVDLHAWYTLRFAPSTPLQPVLAQLHKHPQWFAAAEPEYVHELLTTYEPNDYNPTSSWQLPIIRAPEAWFLEKGDTNITVAILDTGTEWDHPDLLANLRYNYADPIDSVDNDGNGYVDDYRGWDFAGYQLLTHDPDNDPRVDTSVTQNSSFGHGTSVAGYACATPANDTGGLGTGGLVKFMPVKLSAEDMTSAGILNGYDAIVYAADNGADVINCSWGRLGPPSQFELEVIEYATLVRSSLVVAAAGNNIADPDVVIPARYEPVLAVTACTSTRTLGLTKGCACDIAAPGSGLVPAFKGGYYNSFTVYTSFASPVVAGAAAVAKSFFPTYSARQLGELLRVTSDPGIYTISSNVPFAEQYGKGLLDMYRMLTLNSPAVRLDSLYVTDHENGIWEPGDTLEIDARLFNYLMPTVNLQASLSTTTTGLVSLLTASNSYGVLSTLSGKTNSNPFRLVVSPTCPADTTVEFKLRFTDNFYQDYACFRLTLNSTFVDLQTQSLATTANGMGNLGYNNYPENSQGLGLLWQGVDNVLYEGGWLVGTPNAVADNLRKGSTGQKSADFVLAQPIANQVPGPIAFQEVDARFTDQGMGGQALGLEYGLRTYNLKDAPNDRFFIQRLDLHNPNFVVMDSVFAGPMADFDLGASAANDHAAWDSAQKMVYAWSDDASNGNLFVGLLLLEAPAGAQMRGYTASALGHGYTDSAHWQALKRDSVSWNQTDEDVVALLSIGPMKFFPFQRDTLVVAWVMGSSLPDLQAQAQAARLAYLCRFKTQPLTVSLGPDRVACQQTQLDGHTFGAAAYLWSTGHTGSSLTATASGAYSLTVFDAQGCAYTDAVNVQIQPGLSPAPVYSDTLLDLGEALIFSDATPNASLWTWDFGNGFGWMGSSGSYTYPDTGSFLLSLDVTDGICSASVSQNIRIEPVLSRSGLQGTDWKLFPNPARLQVEVVGPADARLQLLNPLGQEVNVPVERSGPGHYRLRLEGLPSGLYVLRLQQGALRHSFNLVVQAVD